VTYLDEEMKCRAGPIIQPCGNHGCHPETEALFFGFPDPKKSGVDRAVYMSRVEVRLDILP
jgi:hypothetical protein